MLETLKHVVPAQCVMHAVPVKLQAKLNLHMQLSHMLMCMASELLDIYMGKLEEQLDRSEDSFRNMSSLLLLLQHFPGDMEPLFQQDVVTFFANQLPAINQLRWQC